MISIMSIKIKILEQYTGLRTSAITFASERKVLNMKQSTSCDDLVNKDLSPGMSCGTATK